ncbi:MAG: phosphatase PAP2 family protein [Dokdonella sp.]|uniref:phosphatase PAP2 family protein n=1 Tax=Dokdonella sp. TaxID=2291710 RepID=UPI0025C4AA25|nr:phosphatase PAP2 family protein [Dokdonella sp.]MBZ0223540.1 phosphatase PAP2 family protein [Dokdonella sp.]MCC7256378.1 phosphatase PAP2 family protein [Dokdonella sp.]
MSRRFLAGAAATFAVLLLIGLLGVDRMLVLWIHDSGLESLPALTNTLNALDTISGLHVWYWLAGCITLALGAIGLLLARGARWPRVLVAAVLVQFATIGSMMIGKGLFGRLRPEQILASGDWTQIWFAGGGSFPSGHSSFYFGLLLPIAAVCPAWWQRLLVLTIPLFAVVTRLDMARHFLSDVSMSALLAALYALIAASVSRDWLPPLQNPR